MTDHNAAATRRISPDPGWWPLFRAGAASAAAAVVLYIVALVLVIATEAAPTDATGAEMLANVDDHRALYIGKQLLWLVPSLFMIVVSLALAIASWQLGRSLALVAGTIAATSWAGSFTWPTTGEGSLAMPILADGWADAASAPERAPFVAGAEVLTALNDMASPLGVAQTVGILLLGLLMLRGVFPMALAWLTVATGVLGIIAEAFRTQLGWGYAIYGLVFFVWLIWVAVALWQLGRQRH